MNALVVSCFLAVLVLNPSACGGEKFHFGASEMRSAIEGTWVLTSDGHVYTFAIAQARRVEQTSARSLIAPAQACGERTLVESASACEVASVMPLEISLLAGATGSFEVSSYTFTSGRLMLYIGDEEFRAEISPHGVATEVTDGASLVRIAAR